MKVDRRLMRRYREKPEWVREVFDTARNSSMDALELRRFIGAYDSGTPLFAGALACVGVAGGVVAGTFFGQSFWESVFYGGVSAAMTALSLMVTSEGDKMTLEDKFDDFVGAGIEKSEAYQKYRREALANKAEKTRRTEELVHG